MKPIFIIFALVAIFCSHFLAAEKPNVIVILTDDQGAVDAGCYGAKDLITPAIDSLAVRGVRFTQFYAAAPLCSPSRAGLLTGRYPLRCRVPTNCASQAGEGVALPPEEVTMAETFKAAGYATAHIASGTSVTRRRRCRMRSGRKIRRNSMLPRSHEGSVFEMADVQLAVAHGGVGCRTAFAGVCGRGCGEDDGLFVDS